LVREGWWLVNTCEACPEQYELVDQHGEKRAYMRLRGGYFQVTCPWVGGDVVLEHTFEWDDLKGRFDSDERAEFLRDAVDAADNWWRHNATPPEGISPAANGSSGEAL
jgi:hypothetical protein